MSSLMTNQSWKSSSTLLERKPWPTEVRRSASGESSPSDARPSVVVRDLATAIGAANLPAHSSRKVTGAPCARPTSRAATATTGERTAAATSASKTSAARRVGRVSQSRMLFAEGTVDFRRRPRFLRLHRRYPGAGEQLLASATPRLGSEVRVGIDCIIAAGAPVATNIVLGEHVHPNVDCTVAAALPGVTMIGKAALSASVPS